MKLPLKLSAIDQEHLQELYDAAGVARDELPYSEQFEKLCIDFQDRSFKNAAPEQVFGALLKYVRSSTNSSKNTEQPPLNPEQIKQLKIILPRHSTNGKVLPYSDEFETALQEFNKAAALTLSQLEFWRALVQAQGGKRRPPPRRAKAVEPAANTETETTDAE
jgi:hypothetical protein